MKVLKIILAILVLGILAVPLSGCNPEPEEEAAESQVTTGLPCSMRSTASVRCRGRSR